MVSDGRHRVVSAVAPRVAPGQPAGAEPGPPQCTVDLDGLECIRGARRVVAAPLSKQRADHKLVDPDQPNEQPLHEVPPAATVELPTTRATARVSELASCALEAPAAAGSARTTTSDPGGRSASTGAMMWRRRRLTRFRVTELPTALLTIKPARGVSVASGDPGNRWTTTSGLAARRPCRTVVENSPRRRTRWVAGSTGSPRKRRSGRQPSAALRPARGNDRAAGAGAHAQAEAVRLGTAAVVRLERALHDRAPESGGHRQ